MNKTRNSVKTEDDDNIRIVEEKIHPDIFSEFFHYLDDSKKNRQPEFRSAFKRKFTEMAITGSIESFREIERSIKQGNLPKEELDFAIVALNYCRFKIENELLDFPADMISGGLGGSSNKMRFFVAVAGKDGISLDQFEFIKWAFEKVTKERDSMLEEIGLHDLYVSLIILGSFDYALGDIIESGIGLCEFLQTDYYATNVEIPTDDRIRDWLDGKLDDDEFSIKT